MAKQRLREKGPSRVEKLWEGLEKRYKEREDADLSYIDRLGSGDQFKDEFVRLPYDALPSKDACRW